MGGASHFEQRVQRLLMVENCLLSSCFVLQHVLFFYGRHMLSKDGRILLLINNDNDNDTTNNDNNDKKNVFKKLTYLLFFIKTFYPTCNKAQVRKLSKSP